MNRRRTFWRDEAGSYSLESAFVFPILFLLILMFLFMGIFTYQNVVVTYAAAITSERAAFGWDNSHRDPKSGILTVVTHDGLYTNMGSDGAIGHLFDLVTGNEEAAVQLPIASGTSVGEKESTLTERKLSQASDWLTQSGLMYNGTTSLANEGLLRFVQTKLNKPIGSSMMQPWGAGGFVDPTGNGKSLITEPVSFIRHVDLARYYAHKFASAASGGSTAKKQAGDVLSSYGGKQP
ncbi:TadE/TadG family type IV pilus assembly protein [Paenibacillus sp. strain BS8-2]